MNLRVTLTGVCNPPVWREIRVPDDINLAELHTIIQRAMGWEDQHLHKFRDAQGSPLEIYDGDFESYEKFEKMTLALPVLRAGLEKQATGPKYKQKHHLVYEYDLGDSWEHIITLEEEKEDMTAPSENKRDFVLVKAKGACPPEDCGGSVGFSDLKGILSNPVHEEHREMTEWLKNTTGSAEFDAHKVLWTPGVFPFRKKETAKVRKSGK